MPIVAGTGDMLMANVDALVNTINTQGVMGKGLALQFKRAFPENYAAYVRACGTREVRVGEMFIVRRLLTPRFIVNFPTKEHWRHPSKLEYIHSGLRDLALRIQRLAIASIAIPPLGCGNGGLAWHAVRPLIVKAFEDLPRVRVILFEPQPRPCSAAPPVHAVRRASAARLTTSRS